MAVRRWLSKNLCTPVGLPAVDDRATRPSNGCQTSPVRCLYPYRVYLIALDDCLHLRHLQSSLSLVSCASSLRGAGHSWLHRQLRALPAVRAARGVYVCSPPSQSVAARPSWQCIVVVIVSPIQKAMQYASLLPDRAKSCICSLQRANYGGNTGSTPSILYGL